VVLPTDTVCWRCGWKLPVHAAADQPGLELASEVQPISVTAVSAYAGLLLVTVVLLFVVFKVLGTYPVVLLDPQAPIKPGWQLITDQRQTFTIELPPGWEWTEDDLNQRLERELADKPEMTAALAPWSEVVDDLDVRLIASSTASEEADGIPGFIVVARSGRLTEVTAEQMVAFWSGRVAVEDLLATAVTEDLQGRPKGTAVLMMKTGGEQWTCRQEGVAGVDGRFLLAACAPTELYEEHGREYEILLSSFQLLLPPS